METPEAQELMGLLRQNSLDTMYEVQTAYQALAPAALDTLQEQLKSGSSIARIQAAREILHASGHVPVKHVVLERPKPSDERYRDKTPEEIREMVLREIFGDPSAEPVAAAVSAPTTKTVQ